MTALDVPLAPAASLGAGRPRRTGRGRLVVGGLTVVAMLPYLGLKALWIGGSHVGIADVAAADDGSLLALNLVTLGMDLAALAVLLAFTFSWGLRLPAVLVVLPMWVGTGFLAPVVLAAPVVAALSPWTSDPASTRPEFLESWVTPLVYAGFTAQGVGLVAAFVLYARQRWSPVFRGAAGGVSGVLRPVYVGGAWLTVALAAPVVLARGTWALGGTLGLTADMVAERPVSFYVLSGVHTLAATAAAAGALLLVHGARRVPGWVPVAATWTGGAALWSWGVWGMVNTLAGTVLASGGEGGPGLLPSVHFVAVLAGMVAGIVGLLVVVQRWADEPSQDARWPDAQIRRPAEPRPGTPT